MLDERSMHAERTSPMGNSMRNARGVRIMCNTDPWHPLLDCSALPRLVSKGRAGYRHQDTLIVMSALRRALCRRCPWLA